MKLLILFEKYVNSYYLVVLFTWTTNLSCNLPPCFYYICTYELFFGRILNQFLNLTTSFSIFMKCDMFNCLFRFSPFCTSVLKPHLWIKRVHILLNLCPWFLIRKAFWYVSNLRILHNIYLFSSSCLCPLLAVSVLYFEKKKIWIGCVN